MMKSDQIISNPLFSWKSIAIIFLFVLLFCFFQNYSFLVSDNFDHVLFIKRFQDPGFLKNDWTTNQIPDANVRFVFTHFISFFTGFLSIEQAFFLIFLINTTV